MLLLVPKFPPPSGLKNKFGFTPLDYDCGCYYGIYPLN